MSGCSLLTSVDHSKISDGTGGEISSAGQMGASGGNSSSDLSQGGTLSAQGGIPTAQGGTSSTEQTYASGGSSIVGTTSIPAATTYFDFPALPEQITTNLNHFLVAGSARSGQTVSLNDAPLPANALGPGNTFSVSVPLSQGTNVLSLSIESETSTTVQSKKTVTYDPTYSTADLQIVYVDVVVGKIYSNASAPAISGTIAIDPKNNAVIGIIQDKHIVGISPDNTEIYFSDRSVYSTSTHQQIRTLAFSATIASNGFLVSPDGTTLYSANQRLDVASNKLLTNLPIDITTGNSYGNAPTPGGPAITSDGKMIYCQSNIKVVHTELSADAGANVAISTGLGGGGNYISDLTLSPDDNTLLMSFYAAGGAVFPYDANTYKTSFTQVPSVGDFMGETSYLPNGNIVASSAGNPAEGGGGIVLLEPSKMTKLSRINLPLADNNAISKAGDIFISAGDASVTPPRIGINMYTAPDTTLVFQKHFALGVNGYIYSTGIPNFDQIRKIVIKE